MPPAASSALSLASSSSSSGETEGRSGETQSAARGRAYSGSPSNSPSSGASARRGPAARHTESCTRSHLACAASSSPAPLHTVGASPK
eukprot:scaffold278765_cov23-Tisochrysis_lutea.AAC.1